MSEPKFTPGKELGSKGLSKEWAEKNIEKDEEYDCEAGRSTLPDPYPYGGVTPKSIDIRCANCGQSFAEASKHECPGKPADTAPVEYIELNLSNYDADDVSQLNEWAIWAYGRLQQPPLPDDLAALIERLESSRSYYAREHNVDVTELVTELDELAAALRRQQHDNKRMAMGYATQQQRIAAVEKWVSDVKQERDEARKQVARHIRTENQQARCIETITKERDDLLAQVQKFEGDAMQMELERDDARAAARDYVLSCPRPVSVSRDFAQEARDEKFFLSIGLDKWGKALGGGDG